MRHLENFTPFLFDCIGTGYEWVKEAVLNDTHMENLCLTEKIHWNTGLAAFDVFHMFTQSIKFF